MTIFNFSAEAMLVLKNALASYKLAVAHNTPYLKMTPKQQEEYELTKELIAYIKQADIINSDLII